MSGGGGSQQSTTYTSNLPEYAKPYFEDIMGRAQEASVLPFKTYEGGRVAAFSPEQQQAQGLIGGMVEMGDPLGTRYAQQGGVDVMNSLRGYNYTPSGITAGNGDVTAGQMGNQLSQADFATVQRFMSPYQQAVIDQEKMGAYRDYDIAGQARNAAAIRAGAFGGSRQAVAEAEAARGMHAQLQGIQTKGLQSAYDRAQEAIQQERAANMNKEQFNIGTALDADKFNVGSSMEAQKATEASRQFAAQSGLQAMQQLAGTSAQMGQLGESQQKLGMERTNSLNAIGAQRQAIEQAKLDQSYQQWASARDYEQNMINWYNSIMRGTPVNTDQTLYQTNQAPSFASQLMAAGTGIAGLSMTK